MNRGALVVVGGFVLLAVGLGGGTALVAAAIPRYEPPPTVAPLPAPVPGAETAPAAPVSPSNETPAGRWADELQSGDVLVTAEQLADYARANEWRVGSDYGEWVAVNELVIDCMAEAGFWFDPRVFRPADGAPPPAGFGRAMDGDTGAGDAYRWEDAGCWGAATHALGTTS